MAAARPTTAVSFLSGGRDVLAAAQPRDRVLDQGDEHVAARGSLPGIAEQQRNILAQVEC